MRRGLLEVFYTRKTFWKSFWLKRSLGVFYTQKNFWRSFINRRPFGGLLYTEDVVAVFYTQRTFCRTSICRRPVEVFYTEKTQRTFCVWRTSICRRPQEVFYRENILWSFICRRPFGGLLYLLDVIYTQKNLKRYFWSSGGLL